MVANEEMAAEKGGSKVVRTPGIRSATDGVLPMARARQEFGGRPKERGQLKLWRNLRCTDVARPRLRVRPKG